MSPEDRPVEPSIEDPLFFPTTGLTSLDDVLCGVRRGDNIVWQIESLDEYRALVDRYAEAARGQSRRLIYFRFAGHSPLCDTASGAEVHSADPGAGFDAFVDQIHRVIEAAGRETMYVFDCLSDLADAWQSDRMMGNFFRLTCPRLFDLDTVTYFAVFRNRHTSSGMEMIIETTQYLLDVFRCRARLYIRPIKVQHRSAAVMNLIHAWEDGDHFRPVVDSGTVSEILARSGWPGLEDADTSNHWQRHFATARALLRERCEGRSNLPAEAECRERLARLLLPEDPGIAELGRAYLELDDLVAIRDRMIGIGAIGGKALGMLLARAILRREQPGLHAQLEAHDSFYVGTEVFDTFFVRNGLWWIRRQQRDPKTFLRQLDEARERIMGGSFTHDILRQFASMLDYFGEWPYIVRSSSRLEDRYGNAFAGQYASVFRANRGAREERMAALLDAVREVYASALSEQALCYRQRRGLLDAHEQMALLIMRVSGTAAGRYFHPHAAGVGLSFNPYRWNPHIDMQAGVIRLVAGLGTRAVDRADDDYTRLVALNAPQLRPEANFGAIARYAQRRMDTLDTEENRVINAPYGEIVGQSVAFPAALFLTREQADRPAFLTFDGLIDQTSFVADMRTLLGSLQAAYRHPVEIEFALNVLAEGYRINLLQCRPLQVRSDGPDIDVRLLDGAPLLVEARGAVIGTSRVIRPERIVHIVPSRYALLNQAERLAVARLIGAINRASAGRTTLLLGPGRWGSRDLWLGIPVAFGEINNIAALCEIVAMHEHLVPDVSLGTHFLNELVEANMLYFALFPQQAGNRIDEGAIISRPNRLLDLVPEAKAWAEAVHVIDCLPGTITLHADAESQRVLVTAGS